LHCFFPFSRSYSNSSIFLIIFVPQKMAKGCPFGTAPS
jgi:hypothetical protein